MTHRHSTPPLARTQETPTDMATLHQRITGTLAAAATARLLNTDRTRDLATAFAADPPHAIPTLGRERPPCCRAPGGRHGPQPDMRSSG